ncbi:putative QWRF family protein [Helianthus anomalus]
MNGLEEDYIRSLSGAITGAALTNSLLRLPISGNIQVNVKDAADALGPVVKTADMMVHQMHMFLP